MGVISDLATRAIDVAGKFIPDADKRLEMQTDVLRMAHEAEMGALKAETDLALGQIEVNRAEAASGNLFVAGWRPAVGWVCVAGLSYQYFLRPVLSPLVAKYTGLALEAVDLGDMMVLLLGMLGLGTLRTAEKFKGVAR